ncbi:MAG: hypothetical protein A2W30_04460 [Ignavibacteria bacterium RBG_16_36_9]|nr:MAG: hypothetical protein A2W30_04460 [Ignavibacteria bacterium RBG_16_36_9]
MFVLLNRKRFHVPLSGQFWGHPFKGGESRGQTFGSHRVIEGQVYFLDIKKQGQLPLNRKDLKSLAQ